MIQQNHVMNYPSDTSDLSGIKDQNTHSGLKRMLLLTDGNIDQASARIRAIQYIPMFEKSGFKVFLIPRTGIKYSNRLLRYFIFPLVKRYLLLKRLYALYFMSWDIIFIQRLFVGESLLQRLKNKTPLIYDFDDAIYISGNSSSARNKAESMIRFADEIIVSTEYLNNFCTQLNRKGIVIPSPVETKRIKPSDKIHKEQLTIGWIGSPWTSDYLKVVEPALQKLRETMPFTFLTVGGKSGYLISGINHISKKWSYEDENDLISEMDIGIMPLPENDFTAGKGGYKLYLYMSGGIPCVASPVGVNRSVIRNGENGFLASTEEQWCDALHKLLTDTQLRIKMGNEGRNDALKYYDRDVCFKKLIEIITRIT